MVNIIEVWRAANFVIKQHGEGAHLHAARRISDLTGIGDHAGALVWSDILAAIVVMTTWEPPESQLACPCWVIRVKF
jgi:hypothetical protein